MSDKKKPAIVLHESNVHQIDLDMQTEKLKRLQSDLSASETKFRRLFEAAQDGILILDADSGQITEVNPFLTDLLGLAREELMGKTLWEIGAFKDIVANQDKFAELQQKEYIRYEDMPLQTRDGRRIEVEFVSNVYLVNNRKVIQCNIRDISDRKRLQRDLSVSETKFRRLFEAAQDGILILDADSGRITEANPFLADLMGVTREELLGKTPWEIGAFKDIVANQDEFAELRRKGFIFYEDMPLETSDGRQIHVEFVSNVYLVDDRKVFQCNIRDVTERTRAHGKLTDALTQLARSNKELESFAYTASHDLKGPLITITGFLGRLAIDTKQGDAKRMHSDLARIGEATKKMDRLLHDLLELSRIGRAVGSLEDVPLTELAREVANLLAGPITERGVRIEISPDLPTVHGERVRLQQLLMNLLGNAVKFMGEQPDPQIKVGLRRDGKETVCYVRDNGVGIDPQHKDRIFGLFQQLDPSRGGTGIGLAIAKRVVETHGGRIWFESDGPGTGSTFCFTLVGRAEPVIQKEQENGRFPQKNLARLAG
jgi:PAS domain S-box-containing protein